jgi:hypothetical protein
MHYAILFLEKRNQETVGPGGAMRETIRAMTPQGKTIWWGAFKKRAA